MSPISCGQGVRGGVAKDGSAVSLAASSLVAGDGSSESGAAGWAAVDGVAGNSESFFCFCETIKSPAPRMATARMRGSAFFMEIF